MPSYQCSDVLRPHRALRATTPPPLPGRRSAIPRIRQPAAITHSCMQLSMPICVLILQPEATGVDAASGPRRHGNIWLTAMSPVARCIKVTKCRSNLGLLIMSACICPLVIVVLGILLNTS